MTGFPMCDRLKACLLAGMTQEEAKASFTADEWEMVEDEWSVLLRWFDRLYQLCIGGDWRTKGKK